MLNFLKSIFRKKQCYHDKNYNLNNYLNEDKTPMTHFYCIDCGYTDKGHVICNTDDKELLKVWIKKEIVRSGKIIKI